MRGRRSKLSDLSLFAITMIPVGLLVVTARISQALIRHEVRLPVWSSLVVLGIPVAVAFTSLGYLVVRGLRSDPPSLCIENQTDVALSIEVVGVPEDHECTRMVVEAGGTYWHPMEPGRTLALCVGSAAVAYDPAGQPVAALDQPLCATQCWVIGTDSGRFVAYLRPQV